MRVLLIFLFLLSGDALANWALVIGGTSNKGKEFHDSARRVLVAAIGLRESGYKTKVLFASRNGRTVSKTEHPADLAAIEKHFGKTELATKRTIEDSLRELGKKVKHGEKVEIVISAHGLNSCEAFQVLPCRHLFVVAGEGGKKEVFDSLVLVEALRELEKKGALVNVVLSSCFSGAILPVAEGLKNTCIYMGGAENSFSVGCYETDFAKNLRDYTSTTEAMIFRYYGNAAEKLDSIDYLAKSKCHGAINDHFRNMDFAGKSIDHVFWRARKSDQSPIRPYINSLQELKYFRRPSYGHKLYLGQEVSCEHTVRELDSIFDFASNLNRTVYEESLHRYLMSIEEFNQEARSAHAIVADTAYYKSLGEEQKMWGVVSQVNARSMLKAYDVIARERELIDLARHLKLIEPSAVLNPEACSRPL